MATNTIDLDFADGEYTFALPLEQIDELQRKCNIGIGGLFSRLLKGCMQDPVSGQMVIVPTAAEFYAIDIIETIRQGLIGGAKGVVNGVETKVTPPLVNTLVRNYVLTKPLADHWSMAASILGACIVGYDPPKKDGPASERADSPAMTTEPVA